MYTTNLGNFKNIKRSPKGFSASKCDSLNWIFSKSQKFFEKLFENFLDFSGEFFVGFFVGDFLEEFFGRYFLGGFFQRIFLWGFFGRNYLVEISKELTFCQDFEVILSQGKKGRKKKIKYLYISARTSISQLKSFSSENY